MKSAIVGCGGISQVHARVLTLLPDIELVACADIRPERAEAMGKEYGCHAYTDLMTMLDNESIDVLHICTPHSLHIDQMELAAARGISIFTEKPPVITQSAWKRFAALEGKVPIGICFQNRYNRTTQHMKRLLESGALGKVLGARAITTWYRDAPYYQGTDWRGTWAMDGGGALMNQQIHTLDLLTYLLGKPACAEAVMANFHLPDVTETEDTVAARILFGEAPALFYVTTAYCVNSPVFLEVVCENGSVRMEDMELVCRYTNGRVERIVFEMDAALGKGYWGSAHIPCITDYYTCLREGKKPTIGIEDVEASINLAIHLYEAAGMRPDM